MGLCLTAMVFVPFCWGTSPGWISVDNQTYDTVYLSRVGDSNALVLVPKRMIGQFQVPWVGQGVPALEALQVSFPGGIVLPETEFRGFDGQYGQPVSLVIVSPQNVTIKYDETGVASSPATNNPSPTGSAGSEGIYGGGMGYGTGYGSPNPLNRNPSPGATLSGPKDYSTLAKMPEPAKKRLLLPQNTGAKVRVVAADSRYKLLDAPAPIRSRPAETAKVATATAAEPQAEEKKGGWGSLITWIIVCVGLVGFIAWNRLSSK
jgi:hypothetical protein